ncbi:capsular polysaccharide biosynthesis protein [Bermanella sp. R86510]|uniref:capsular polysaccharide biosynthesis protein n=1 Tax=unclassified Bermanella TaxID=2627862 RepID=UPI0037CB83D9
MKFFARSRGITRNPQIAKLLNTDSVRVLRFSQQIKANHILVGWGFKPNTMRLRELAQEYSCSYWALEDGFISWLTHPTQSKPHQRLSYIVDSKGIYYNCHDASGLDHILANETGALKVDVDRIDRLMEQILKLEISKYNHARLNLVDVPGSEIQRCLTKGGYLLLVDQTFADASIELADGCQADFKRMISVAAQQARAEKRALVIKTHPDVLLGKKRGCILPNWLSESAEGVEIHYLTQDVSPKQLIAGASDVYTVSSQLGFEALWQHKPVHCFAWPFYAGRGLTIDYGVNTLTYNRPSCSWHELMYAALLAYPVYMHPDTQRLCSIEDIVDYLQAHLQVREFQSPEVHAPNFSLWKRSFIPEFLSQSTFKVRFSSESQTHISPHNQFNRHALLLWGMQKPHISNSGEQAVWRMEDGFIRSVGLGADLRRPSSLVLDDEGIYYNGKQASRLESLLNNYSLTDYEVNRAHTLLRRLRQRPVSKYNVEHANTEQIHGLRHQAQGRPMVLVVGQFEQDLSMTFGADEAISDNKTLLAKARADYPDAFIVYKEHPDVYSGVRPGKLSSQAVAQWADAYVTDVPLIQFFPHISTLCTICSLAGFEAMIHGVNVRTYGLPFYAGWGLTSDLYSLDRRARTRRLYELVYIALVLYPRYINWSNRSITTVEVVLEQFQQAQTKHQGRSLKSHWLGRQIRKSHYLLQALLK